MWRLASNRRTINRQRTNITDNRIDIITTRKTNPLTTIETASPWPTVIIYKCRTGSRKFRPMSKSLTKWNTRLRRSTSRRNRARTTRNPTSVMRRRSTTPTSNRNWSTFKRSFSRGVKNAALREFTWTNRAEMLDRAAGLHASWCQTSPRSGLTSWKKRSSSTIKNWISRWISGWGNWSCTMTMWWNRVRSHPILIDSAVQVTSIIHIRTWVTRKLVRPSKDCRFQICHRESLETTATFPKATSSRTSRPIVSRGLEITWVL